MNKKRIITFTRRSDPSFYMDWFADSVKNGYCSVPNPFTGKPYLVSLKPEDVLLLTFWTKNPQNLVTYIKQLKDFYKTAFFITLNNYPQWIERNLPDLEIIKNSINKLTEILSPDHLWWRYDPVIFTETMTSKWHINNFTNICESVWKGKTKRVFISMVQHEGGYSFIEKNLNNCAIKANDSFIKTDYIEFINLLKTLSQIARSFDIALEVCCSPKISEKDKPFIKQGACLSKEYISKIVDEDLSFLKIKGTRKANHELNYAECLCLESVDIGIKNTCKYGCIYCYANRKLVK